MPTLGVAGAGFSGAVVARQVAEAGHEVIVFDTRDHVAGNCHTARDAVTGVMVHEYGPHIFHTPHEPVWNYVRRFGSWTRYDHRVRATAGGRVFSLPVNLLTINQFFGMAMSPSEAAAFVAARAEGLAEPVSFEDQAMRFVGRELYEAFFAGYTAKQWGRDPSELPASILKRLPLRFSYDDRYFDHRFQAIPTHGYTPIVEAILDHPRIDVRLSTPLPISSVDAFDHVLWTGPIDSFFGWSDGRLAYRTLRFERERYQGDYQGCAVMNFCDRDVPFTRTTEFKHFTSWEDSDDSVVYREYPAEAGPDDVPYYPVRLVGERQQLSRYVERARSARGVTFAGRLGTYRYLDMDATIHEALGVAAHLIEAFATSTPPAPFVIDPAA